MDMHGVGALLGIANILIGIFAGFGMSSPFPCNALHLTGDSQEFMALCLAAAMG